MSGREPAVAAARPDTGARLEGVGLSAGYGRTRVLDAVRGDHALAMQRLDAAGELFANYGARLYLDQVLAKKEILKA